MKFKKIISLVLTCLLMFNPLSSRALYDNESSLIMFDEINKLKYQQKVLKGGQQALEEKIQKLIEENKKLSNESNAKEYVNGAIKIINTVIRAFFVYEWLPPVIDAIWGRLNF